MKGKSKDMKNIKMMSKINNKVTNKTGETLMAVHTHTHTQCVCSAFNI